MNIEGTFRTLSNTCTLFRDPNFKEHVKKKQYSKVELESIKKTADVLRNVIEDTQFDKFNNPAFSEDKIRIFKEIQQNLDAVWTTETTKIKNAKQKKINLKITPLIIKTMSDLSNSLFVYADDCVNKGVVFIGQDLKNAREKVIGTIFEIRYPNADIRDLNMQISLMGIKTDIISSSNSIMREVFSLSRIKPREPKKDFMSVILKQTILEIKRLNGFYFNQVDDHKSNEDECKISRSHGSVSSKSTASSSSTPMEVSEISSISSRQSISSKSTSSPPITPPKVSLITENFDAESVGSKTVSHAEFRSNVSRKSLDQEEERPRSANGKSEIRNGYFFSHKPPVH